jgi:hypothetical protein
MSQIEHSDLIENAFAVFSAFTFQPRQDPPGMAQYRVREVLTVADLYRELADDGWAETVENLLGDNAYAFSSKYGFRTGNELRDRALNLPVKAPKIFEDEAEQMLFAEHFGAHRNWIVHQLAVTGTSPSIFHGMYMVYQSGGFPIKYVGDFPEGFIWAYYQK